MKYILFAGLLMPLQSTAQRILPFSVEYPPPYNVFDIKEYGGKLWIAGLFTSFNSQPVSGLLTWDGQAYANPIPGSDLSAVNDLQTFNGGLAIAGHSVLANDVLFHDGNNFVPLQGQFSSPVKVLSTYNGELYAGGNFTSVSGQSVRCLAKWTGSQWIQVGPGLNGSVKCMTVFNGQLYIGGAFTATSNAQFTLPHVAVWNGTTFNPAGPGLSGQPTSMVPVNGELWIAGSFTFTADSAVQLNGRTKWDGSSFTPLAPDESYLSTPLNVVELDSSGVLLSPSVDCTGGSARWVNNAWEHLPYSRISRSASFGGRILISGAFTDRLPDKVSGLAAFEPQGSDRGYLHVAGISAFVRPLGTLFNDIACSRPAFAIGNEDAPSTIFNHSQYIAAFAGDSSFASSFMNNTENGDYSPGPRCHSRNEDMIGRYDHVWFVDKGMLWDHAANWNVPGHSMSADIGTWPGNGEPNNGEPAIVAPFDDVDLDGTYEPENGELPSIKGDRAAYSVITDQLGDTVSFDRPAQFDVHQLVFGFDDAVEASLFQTIFVSYQFINRSQRSYDSVIVALHTNFDIGCASDDYIGSDADLGYFYAYNSNLVDTDCDEQKGFGPHPPAQGIVGLNLAMRSFIDLQRTGPQCNNDPLFSSHAVNFALGRCAYGEPQLDPSTGDTTLFAFHDYPDVPGGYSGVNFSQPNDVRGIASFGPVYNIAPGDTICLDVAFVYARDTTKDNIENVRVLQEKVQAVKAWYAQQSYSCGQYPVLGLSDPQVRGIEARLFPNPTTSAITLERTMADQPAVLFVYSLSGQMIMSTTIPADQHLVTLKTADLSEGPYAVHIRCGNAVQCLRFVKVSAAP